mmetsp:Transcript_37013/g.78154  ORF Transcript_37013/g.78154 Transcript_37013/m.78154 type:complete len:329 (-) Transcript_37013:1195-2181(-)
MSSRLICLVPGAISSSFSFILTSPLASSRVEPSSTDDMDSACLDVKAPSEAPTSSSIEEVAFALPKAASGPISDFVVSVSGSNATVELDSFAPEVSVDSLFKLSANEVASKIESSSTTGLIRSSVSSPPDAKATTPPRPAMTPPAIAMTGEPPDEVSVLWDDAAESAALLAAAAARARCSSFSLFIRSRSSFFRSRSSLSRRSCSRLSRSCSSFLSFASCAAAIFALSDSSLFRRASSVARSISSRLTRSFSICCCLDRRYSSSMAARSASARWSLTFSASTDPSFRRETRISFPSSSAARYAGSSFRARYCSLTDLRSMLRRTSPGA